jgi:hypothetical protein
MVLPTTMEAVMNSVCIHIDEKLHAKDMQKLKKDLMHVPHVTHVELNAKNPHDLVVEYEEHHNIPMIIQNRLHEQGLHTDIVSG